LPGTFRTEISPARNFFGRATFFCEKNPEKIPDTIYPSSNAGFTLQDPVCIENYPFGFIIASNLVSLLMYISGAFLLHASCEDDGQRNQSESHACSCAPAGLRKPDDATPGHSA